MHIVAMKTPKGAIVIQRLDERRYAVTVEGIVRYVGTQEECQRALPCWAKRRIGRTKTKHWRGRSG